ncbi:MAG: hypothetical protein ACI94Y_001713 [Maribacter sp.]|jgi:hypothetical protein
MADFTENIVNQRFREIYESLENSKAIKGKSDLASKLGTYNHVINSILKGKRNITIEQLSKLFDIYNINANYLFGLSSEKFLIGGMASGDVDTQATSMMNFGSRSNITLVNDKVRAGYAVGHQDPTYLQDLPKFSLPNLAGEDLLAFEIDGDSMMPTITQGDLVVCQPLERNTPIYDNHVYVVVTDVLVAKRVQQIRSGNELQQLRLISDNNIYQPYNVPVEEVTQLLKVKCRVTSYAIG